MSILSEFKAFAMRGNAIDLAVGIVVGAAFTGIVNSLVKDLINPPLGLLLGGIDFSNFFVVLSGNGTYATLKQATDAGAVTVNYGLFLNTLINFLIVALALFIIIKQVNTPHRAARGREARRSAAAGRHQAAAGNPRRAERG